MHPIIFLWAHPRSVSTATERVMRERGDLQCLHEPFLHYYYLQKTDKNLALFDSEEDHPESYEATRDMVLEKAGKITRIRQRHELLRDAGITRRPRVL